MLYITQTNELKLDQKTYINKIIITLKYLAASIKLYLILKNKTKIWKILTIKVNWSIIIFGDIKFIIT